MRFQAAFALLLALQLAFPQINPALVSSSSVVLEESGTVSISSGSFYTLSLNLSVPTSLPYQRVTVDSAVHTDSEGNSYISINERRPPNPYLYSRRITVEPTARQTLYLPATYTIPSSYLQYLSPSNRTQSDSPEIRAAALEATAGARSDFEKMAMLAIYVHRTMQYDESLLGAQEDALWALQNKRGVCVEYSSLFVAMARSIGMPARYVVGYSYSERFNGWLGHAWAEAYIGEWVPVDPTWMEAGHLDALHIEASKHREFTTGSTASATVSSPNAQLKWESTGRSGAFANNIETLELESSAYVSDYSLILDDSIVPPGGSTIATLQMRGADYRVVPVTLSSCTGASRVDIPMPRQFLILEPGKISTVQWQITAPSDVDRGFVYTCPLLVNSPYLSGKAVSLEINPRAPDGRQPSSGEDSNTTVENPPIIPPNAPLAEQKPPEQPRPPSPEQPRPEASESFPPPCPLLTVLSVALILIAFSRR